MERFSSGFAAKLEAMIEYRVIRGLKEKTYVGDLIKFDKYSSEHFPNVSELTREVVHSWYNHETNSTNYLTGKTIAIRQFGKYLNAIGEEAHILPDKFSPNKDSFNPYIFTDAELTSLFIAIDTLSAFEKEPFLSEIAPVLFRLTYTCGLRPNEGRELLCSNINLNTGEILITNTKRCKERIVVMSDDMLALAQKYNLRREIISNGIPYFFPANNGSTFSGSQILAAFNKAWSSATRTSQNPVPRTVRVYDLRHRFASACLNRWLDNGDDLMNRLPYLRTYMGHGALNETAYYIHILPENLVKSSGVNWDALNAVLPEVDV